MDPDPAATAVPAEAGEEQQAAVQKCIHSQRRVACGPAHPDRHSGRLQLHHRQHRSRGGSAYHPFPADIVRWSSTRCRWQASCYRSLAGQEPSKTLEWCKMPSSSSRSSSHPAQRHDLVPVAAGPAGSYETQWWYLLGGVLELGLVDGSEMSFAPKPSRKMCTPPPVACAPTRTERCMWVKCCRRTTTCSTVCRLCASSARTYPPCWGTTGSCWCWYCSPYKQTCCRDQWSGRPSSDSIINSTWTQILQSSSSGVEDHLSAAVQIRCFWPPSSIIDSTALAVALHIVHFLLTSPGAPPTSSSDADSTITDELLDYWCRWSSTGGKQAAIGR